MSVSKYYRKEKIMGIKKRYKFYDYCPCIEKETNFYVDYEDINMVGNSHTYSVKLGYSCPSLSECSLEHSNECPLFRKTPEDIHQ